MEGCAKIMLTEIKSYLQRSDIVENVYICLWDDEALQVFVKELDQLSA
jgi:O-acetyl-ADP-ribose deacetylase (regulator of RNase III)